MRHIRRLAVERLEVRALLAVVPTNWDERGVGGGGALFSPELSPYSTTEMFIASDMSQLFHSTTAGATWSTVDFRQIQTSPVTQVEYTENPTLLYAIDVTGDVGRITKSTDGGQTWTPLAADPLGGESAYKLVVDPANHLRMAVSDYSRLFFSADGGTTFSQKFSTSDPNGLHVAGAFFDGNNIFIATNQGLLQSTNAGQSFAVASVSGMGAGEAMLSFAGARQNGVTRFFAVTRSATNIYAGITGTDYGPSKAYTLDWGSGAWIPRAFAATTYPSFVAMAQNNTSIAYLSGGGADGRPSVLKTIDGGATWQSVFLTTRNQNIATGYAGDGGDLGWTWPEAALGFTVAANDPSRLLITDFGFAHLSTDGGASWRQLYVNPADQNPADALTPQKHAYRSSGLDNVSSWGITWTSPNQMIVSSTDIKGVRSDDGGQTFSFNYTGHTRNTMYGSAVQPATGVVYAATSSVHDLYQSTYLTDARIDSGNGAVLYSSDQGHAWQTLHDFGKPVVWVATDPTNADRLYASVVNSTQGAIYVSNNIQQGAASTWTRLASPPRTEGHPYDIRVLNDGTLVVSYSGRRGASGFTASSGVFVSADGGNTWSDRSDPGMRYWTKDVVVDPADASQNTWYAGVFSGWGGPPNGLGGLYKTTNRGLSWTRIVNLDRVESVTVDPTDGNAAYLTTEVDGLWHTDNLRAATPTFTQVASYPFRHPQRVFLDPYDPSQIWVTNFGGGLRVGSTAAANVVLGDMNGDGVLDNFDIGPFELALTDPAAYQQQDPALTDYTRRGDVNQDGHFDNFDIPIFESMLTTGHANSLETAASRSSPAPAILTTQAVPAPMVVPAQSPNSNASGDTSAHESQETRFRQIEPLPMVQNIFRSTSAAVRRAAIQRVFSTMEEVLSMPDGLQSAANG